VTGIKIVGYAQIAVKTARTYGIKGSDSEIKERLNSYEGSVEAAAKILKDWLCTKHRLIF
jgi:hypothetical protein